MLYKKIYWNTLNVK